MLRVTDGATGVGEADFDPCAPPRRRFGGRRTGGSAHAYRVPDDGGSAAVWWAPCGAEIKPDEAEIVATFTGVVCERCWMLAMLASDAPSVTRAELEGAPVRGELPEASPAGVVVEPAADALMYAPSWRERVVHFAAADAEPLAYEGGTVVIGLCGEIGWGPHEHAPHEWPMCVECVQIAGART